MEKQPPTGKDAMKYLLSFLSSLVYFTFIFSLFSCAKKNEPTLSALINDRKASLFISKKQNEHALNSYYKILESDSGLASVHSNIGILFLEDKKSDDGLKSLNLALKLATDQGDLKAQFAIRYNLGVYYGLNKKIPEALENYQQALELIPDSKETKHNIELLIQSGSDQSKGDSDKKEKNDKQDQQDQDKKDKDGKDGKDKDENKKDDDKDSGKDKKNKDYEKNSKYKPRPFKSGELSEGDVKKILGEIKNQEQKIRANFDKKERKDKKNEKDW